MAVTVKEGKGNKSSLVATVKKKFYMHRFHEFSIISWKREARMKTQKRAQNQENGSSSLHICEQSYSNLLPARHLSFDPAW